MQIELVGEDETPAVDLSAGEQTSSLVCFFGDDKSGESVKGRSQVKRRSQVKGRSHQQV